MSPGLPESSGNTSAEQTVIFVIDDFVTLADRFFQPLPVNYCYRSPIVCNQFFRCKFSGSQRYAFAPHAEHIGNEVVRHHQLIRMKAVVAQKQPPAKLLFDRMQTVANGSL